MGRGAQRIAGGLRGSRENPARSSAAAAAGSGASGGTARREGHRARALGESSKIQSRPRPWRAALTRRLPGPRAGLREGLFFSWEGGRARWRGGLCAPASAKEARATGAPASAVRIFAAFAAFAGQASPSLPSPGARPLAGGAGSSLSALRAAASPPRPPPPFTAPRSQMDRSLANRFLALHRSSHCIAHLRPSAPRLDPLGRPRADAAQGGTAESPPRCSAAEWLRSFAVTPRSAPSRTAPPTPCPWKGRSPSRARAKRT